MSASWAIVIVEPGTLKLGFFGHATSMTVTQGVLSVTALPILYIVLPAG